MNSSKIANPGIRWLWAATIGLLIYLLVQIFPVAGNMFDASGDSVLSRSAAEAKALTIARDRFGVDANDVRDVTLTHLSNHEAVGYLSKNELAKSFGDEWEPTNPTDVYRADLTLADGSGKLLLSMNMETGKLVSWRHASGRSSSSSKFSGSADDALSYAAFWGALPDRWKMSSDEITDDGVFRFVAAGAGIGDAKLWMEVKVPAGYSPLRSSMPNWHDGYVAYGIQPPASFVAYLDRQDNVAEQLSKYGFLVPQVLLLILAIVYSGSFAELTSYRRGIFLSAVFLLFYIAITYNVIPGQRAGDANLAPFAGDGVDYGVVQVSIVVYAAMALLTYFSAVAGDGLWKSMGRSLWPRWKEAGYGDYVLRSMKTGYLLAFILLGAQSVILLALEGSIGSFSTSDPSQSMYNMVLPMLLPLLAWCAGISEELQSRFFGVALFRSWFVGLTAKLIGKEPSARTATGLTIAAMVPAGLIWALGHVGYAVYPVYTRLIELLIMGMLFGWFMLRFGLIAVIFAHVALDAILMGAQMLTDGLPNDNWAGLFSFVMPVLAGYVIWRLHRTLRGRAAAP